MLRSDTFYYIMNCADLGWLLFERGFYCNLSNLNSASIQERLLIEIGVYSSRYGIKAATC